MLEQNREIFKRFGILGWHEKGYRGKGITIAVLDDTGKNNDLMEGNYYNPFPDNTGTGHIMNVSHIIGQGLPEAKVVLLPYIQDKGAFKDRSAQWIRDNKPDVVNCSFSLNIPNFFNQNFEGLDDVVFICSSGNNGRDRVSVPARLNYTIAVGAYSYNLNSVASYSNWGKELDCVAPTNIYVIGSTGNIFAFNGTSGSSPMMSIAVGLYIQYAKEHGLEYDTETIRKWIHDNCNFEWMGKGSADRAGHGLFTMPKLESMPKVGEDMEIKLKIDSPVYTVNGDVKEMDVAPFIIDDRTFVPIRFIAEALGCDVEWDDKKYEVIIRK